RDALPLFVDSRQIARFVVAVGPDDPMLRQCIEMRATSRANEADDFAGLPIDQCPDRPQHLGERRRRAQGGDERGKRKSTDPIGLPSVRHSPSLPHLSVAHPVYPKMNGLCSRGSKSDWLAPFSPAPFLPITPLSRCAGDGWPLA